MYALLQRSRDKKFYVRDINIMSRSGRRDRLVVYSQNFEPLRQISENLNNDVPRIEVRREMKNLDLNKTVVATRREATSSKRKKSKKPTRRGRKKRQTSKTTCTELQNSCTPSVDSEKAVIEISSLGTQQFSLSQLHAQDPSFISPDAEQSNNQTTVESSKQNKADRTNHEVLKIRNTKVPIQNITSVLESNDINDDNLEIPEIAESFLVESPTDCDRKSAPEQQKFSFSEPHAQLDSTSVPAIEFVELNDDQCEANPNEIASTKVLINRPLTEPKNCGCDDDNSEIQEPSNQILTTSPAECEQGSAPSTNIDSQKTGAEIQKSSVLQPHEQLDLPSVPAIKSDNVVDLQYEIDQSEVEMQNNASTEVPPKSTAIELENCGCDDDNSETPERKNQTFAASPTGCDQTSVPLIDIDSEKSAIEVQKRRVSQSDKQLDSESQRAIQCIVIEYVDENGKQYEIPQSEDEVSKITSTEMPPKNTPTEVENSGGTNDNSVIQKPTNHPRAGSLTDHDQCSVQSSNISEGFSHGSPSAVGPQKRDVSRSPKQANSSVSHSLEPTTDYNLQDNIDQVKRETLNVPSTVVSPSTSMETDNCDSNDANIEIQKPADPLLSVSSIDLDKNLSSEPASGTDEEQKVPEKISLNDKSDQYPCPERPVTELHKFNICYRPAQISPRSMGKFEAIETSEPNSFHQTKRDFPNMQRTKESRAKKNEDLAEHGSNYGTSEIPSPIRPPVSQSADEIDLCSDPSNSIDKAGARVLPCIISEKILDSCDRIINFVQPSQECGESRPTFLASKNNSSPVTALKTSIGSEAGHEKTKIGVESSESPPTKRPFSSDPMDKSDASYQTPIDTSTQQDLNPFLSTARMHSPISAVNENSLNESTKEALQKPENLHSMSFLETEDDEWLPEDVQYEMSDALNQVLSYTPPIANEQNHDDSTKTEEPHKEVVRGLANDESTASSPLNLQNTSGALSLPNISDANSTDDSMQQGIHVDTRDTSEENNDDSLVDKDYLPSDRSENSEDSESDAVNNNTSKGSRGKRTSKSANTSANGSGILDISTKARSGAPDNTNMVVQTSDNKKGDKKYFCMYCNKLYHKLTRHLETVHKDESDVQKFSALPKRSAERRAVIDVLRKTGNFIFNTSTKYNNGELLISRRPNAKYNKTASDYKTCANCLENYTVTNIRHHAANCFPDRKKTQRSVMVLGRTVEGRLHDEASDKLRLEVFPVLREDDTVRLIRYDRLLIIWGNKLCQRYTPHYQHNMIRARLRLMGRMLAIAKSISPQITDFASLYNPKLYDQVVKAARLTARFDEEKGEYGAPAVGMNLGTYIKQIGEILINEYIKSDDVDSEHKVERFLKVLKVDFSVDVNKVALETQRKHQRQRKIVLPSTDDVKKLITYLKKEMDKSYTNLSKSYSYDEWVNLAELAVASIVVFNCRRTGEIQNILLDDFKKNQETIDEKTDKELYGTLSAESRIIANKYVRIMIRGKKNRNVPVLLYPELLRTIHLLVDHRKDARVPKDNTYLFGLPYYNKKRTKVVDACEAMRKFSKLCGAANPETLRGTQLRKHIATQCITLNLDDNEVSDLANFMGHAEKIHKDIYRQPIKSREIVGIARLLEAARGADESNDDSSDDENFSDTDDRHDDDLMTSRQQQSGSSDSDEGDENEMLNEVVQGKSESSLCEDEPPPQKKATKRRTPYAEPDQSVKRRKLTSQDAIKKITSQKGASLKTTKISPETVTQKKSKRRWTIEEKEAATKVFAKHLKAHSLPSYAEIKEAKSKYPSALGGRTVPQLKTWVDNQNKAKKGIKKLCNRRK